MYIRAPWGCSPSEAYPNPLSTTDPGGLAVRVRRGGTMRQQREETVQ
ncbi:hypothetical protein [Kitasatospora azatica]|nr:hypothetical protein [Kitasatospora azatica]